MTHGLALCVLHDVGVDVHRDRDLAVPEDLHHDTGSDPGGDEQGRAAVLGIVQPDHPEPGGVGDPGERAVQVARLDRLTTADESKLTSRFAWECKFQVPDSAADKGSPQ